MKQDTDLFVGEYKEQGIPQLILTQHPLHCLLISNILSLSRNFTYTPRAPQ